MSPGGPALRLLDIILGAHTLVLSRFILDEVERVLLYPRIQARYQIAASEAARFTGSLADAAHMVEPVIVRPCSGFRPGRRPSPVHGRGREARSSLYS